MKIKELPDEEKPRERLIKYGVNNISNEDLLSIILRTGTKDTNVKELSINVLNKIKKLENLDELSLGELTEIKGLGKVKAITLLAAIELGKRVSNKTITDKLVIDNSEKVNLYFSQIIVNPFKEKLLVILLDNKKRLISYQIMYEGTMSEMLASPKEIFNYAIKERASALILMHNHPSGITNPSLADQNLTNQIIASGKLLGIPLLDHLITNGKSYYSFYETIKNEV